MLKSVCQYLIASKERRVYVEIYLRAKDIRRIHPFNSTHAAKAVACITAEGKNIDVREFVYDSIILTAKHVSHQTDRLGLAVSFGSPERVDAFSLPERAVSGSAGSGIDSCA